MSAFDDLLRHPALWRAREQPDAGTRAAALPTGYAALDRHLPGGGWPRQGLVEILTDRCGIGELSLLMPALAALCGDDADRGRDGAPPGGWLAWVSPPYQPYAPAFAARGIDLGRLLVVRAQPAEWAMEQALRSGACSAVIGWAACRDRHGLRRLQLAAEQSRSLAVLFRGLADGNDPSPAVLRIALEAGRAGLEARILKSRGGRPVTVPLGWLDPAAQAVAH
ncbi:MAG: translesion DNA synthesis-associated protein ImuA [Steroidobacteraceae bacterium]